MTANTVSPKSATYDLHGLRVRSEVLLNALPSFDIGTDIDIDIVWGPTTPVAPDAPPGEILVERFVAGSRFYTGVRDSNQFVLRAHGLCDFLIDLEVRSVQCRPDRDEYREYVPLLLSGTVIAFLLGLAGKQVLHGSAVEIDGHAIAFVGPSGAGKSTMAALMCSVGARLITDDVLHLEVTERVECLRSAHELRLRPMSLSVLDGFGTAPPTQPTVDGKIAVGLEATPRQAVHLTQLVAPSPSRTASQVELRRLKAAEAVLTVVGNPRILGWRDETLCRAQFEFATRLAQIVPIWSVVIPWGPPFSGDLAHELLKRLSPGA